MYAITGITGKVGGEHARTLLAARQPVRGIVRDAKKGEEWAALGCELAVAEMEDASALTDAFGGAIGTNVPTFLIAFSAPQLRWRRARRSAERHSTSPCSVMHARY